jgi:uncharacterized membrane-anchored protein
MRWTIGFFAGVAWLSFLNLAPAQTTAEDREAANEKIVSGLHFRTGDIPIGSNLATIRLPANFRYLDSQDSTTVLTQLWGNPPKTAEGNLGMIVPSDADLLAPGSWVVVISYEEDGHIKDDDAKSINYDDLLKRMQKSVEEVNPEREKQGYPAMHLVGWAAPPKYDAQGKKLYWAKELSFSGDAENTLNYNIRILGRKGVLNLNAISNNSGLSQIEAATPELLSAVSFNKGNRYEDFDRSTDKVAAYGLAALVAGGVAAKLGLFKMLWLAVLAFKKFIIIGAVALGAFFKRVFGKFFKKPTDPYHQKG